MEWTDTDLEKIRVKLRYKVGYHLGRYCSDVEDIVQETLVRFLNVSKEGHTHIENPGAFLSGICNNVIKEYRRQIWRDSSDTEVPEPADPHTSNADLLATRDSVDRALSQLSYRDRMVLRAIFLEDKTPEEVARQASIQESHVRVVVFRAKDRFRKVYESGKGRTA